MSLKSATRRFVRTSPSMSGYVLLVIGLALNIAVQGGAFFTADNMATVFGSNTPLIVASMAQFVAILVGGIDLSTGSIMTLANTLIITLTNKMGWSNTNAWALALAAGTAVGLLNGFIIAYIRIPAILATLATSTLVGGLALFVLPRSGGSVPQEVYSLYGGFLGGLPTTVWVILLMILIWALLTRFRLGKAIRAVGGNERAAYASGIPTERVKLFAYTLAGFYAAIAGLCLTGLTAAGDPRIGLPFTLNSVAGVILGGTLFNAGWGSIGGTVAGALFFAIVNQIVFFVFSNVSMIFDFTPSPYIQNLLSSLIIVLGLASAVFTYQRQVKAQKRESQKGGADER
jgi:ribose transport system permease protein